MARMLASVANVQEAKSLLSVGVDILDIKDPHKGALGAVTIKVAAEIVQVVAGRLTTSATIGDMPMQADLIDSGLTGMRPAGVDIIKAGVFAAEIPPSVLHVLHRHAQDGARIVLVFFADRQPLVNDFTQLADTGIYGVMLDTANKSGGSLRTRMDDALLDDFIRQGRGAGLLTGLAGSLQQEDIPPLLKLDPDYLGFRGALCSQGQRQMAIDVHAARSVRALIPAIKLPAPFMKEGKSGGRMVIVPPSQPSP